MKLRFVVYALALIFGSAVLLSMTTAPQGKPWKAPDKFAKMKAPKSTPESVAKGKDLYTKNCKSCHGATGKGDGTKSASLKSKINAFSDKEFKGLTDGDKYYRAFVGRDEMPNFEKKITDENDRWAIVHYLGTL
jgi:mono/diheme cytochrome c family protein